MVCLYDTLLFSHSATLRRETKRSATNPLCTPVLKVRSHVSIRTGAVWDGFFVCDGPGPDPEVVAQGQNITQVV